jgi:chromosome segregation ATPase
MALTSMDLVCLPGTCCREQLDNSYDKLKQLRQQESAILADMQRQQAADSSSQAELAALQAAVEELRRRKVSAALRPCWCFFNCGMDICL